MNLNQVTLPAIDVASSVSFYLNLGLRLIVDSRPLYARFECPEGVSTLSVHHIPFLAPKMDHVIYFECENLDQHVERLKALGVQFTQDPTDEKWLWREARLLDPSNNEICLYWAGENRRFPPWRVQT